MTATSHLTSSAADPDTTAGVSSGRLDLRQTADREWEPRVLVVDDDPVVCLAAQGLLERVGLAVDVAADGPEAVRMSAEWPYVAIFMDCYMPDVDGFAATRRIRTHEGLAHAPLVIAVTSRSRYVCLASGMDHHIAKPLRMEALRADCIALGLTPARSRDGGETRATVVPASASLVPSLIPRPGLTRVRTAELAAAFARRAELHLPRLWRAVNAADTGSAQRIARDLAQHATSVGAARLAALCETLAEAAARGRADELFGLEPQIRRAIRQTAVAAREELEPGEVAAAQPAETAPTAAVAPSVSTTPQAASPRPAPPAPIRVAVADDDALARMAIEAMVARGDGLELVGSAADVPSIVELAVDRRPDVAVLDFMMPGGGGAEAARQIRERCPQTRIIALTASEGPDTYLAMLKAGASGRLVKGGPAEKLVAMIHRSASAQPA